MLYSYRIVAHFGEILRNFIKSRLHRTLREFAANAKVSTDTLNRAFKMSSGDGLNPSTYRAIAEAAGLTPRQLDTMWREVPQEEFVPVKLKEIPYFAQPVACGDWVEVESRTVEEADGRVAVPADMNGELFAVKLVGDSMEPRYMAGDIVIFRPIRFGESASEPLEEARDYYVQDADQRATFKRLYIDREREAYRLEPLNPKYKSMLVPYQLVSRLSRAVRVVRDVG